MAGHSLPAAISFFIVSLVIPFSLFIRSSSGCGNSVYWGQNRNEGTLRAACSNPYPYYKYIAIAFLTASGETPVLKLDGHCDPALGTCKKLSSDIDYCQSQGIKVLLSVDGSFGRYSPEVADQLAEYVYTDFLGGGSGGPLGKVVLDGVDFFINRRSSIKFWPAFANALSQFTTPKGKVYLSASPQCPLPDNNYDDAIKTGLFDYVWVQFYKNPQCDIRAGVSGLLKSWNDWSSYLAENSPNSEVFMGLPASPDVDAGGYIYPCVLVPEILPVLRNTSNYGGLMLWNRHYDIQNSYSPRVVVPACIDPQPPRVHGEEELLVSQV